MNYRLSEYSPDWSEMDCRANMIEGGLFATTEGIEMKPKTFGERLFWARKRYAGITQVELRDRMEKYHGVSVGSNYISELENETTKKRPSFNIVRAMAAVLNVSMDFLAGFTDEYERVDHKVVETPST